jgi:excisionase family DNA binding protein
MGRKSADLAGLPAEDALVSSVTAARYWGVSRQMVSKLVKNRRIPAVRIGSSVLIPRGVVLSVAKLGLPSSSRSEAPVPTSMKEPTLLEQVGFCLYYPDKPVEELTEHVEELDEDFREDLRSVALFTLNDCAYHGKPLPDHIARRLSPPQVRLLEKGIRVFRLLMPDPTTPTPGRYPRDGTPGLPTIGSNKKPPRF